MTESVRWRNIVAFASDWTCKLVDEVYAELRVKSANGWEFVWIPALRVGVLVPFGVL